ncbi:MAG: hypothetical protein PHH16_03085 [Candidatus Gracilibacteria bacterium]|nr:hypothetical protein [Candidatus Gracilibacteria bacterium]
MNTSLKRIVALSTVIGLVAMNAAYAATGQIGTGSIIGGGTAPIIYDDVSLQATGTLSPITVSAIVAPTLDMTISSGSLNLGTLSTSTVNTTSFDVSVSTNSTNGVTSNTGGLATAGGDLIGFTGATLTGGVQGYNLTVTGATQTAGAVPTIPVSTVATAANVNILTVVNPTKNAKVTVSANAAADALTPAGSYSIVHTFTVTGTF